MRPTDIFTPSDYPTHTYVAREEETIEARLRQALDTPGEVVSVSGPSKSGKTVLIEKIAGRENLIPLTGAGISSADDVWEKVLNWMDVPTSVVDSSTGGVTVAPAVRIGGKVGVPGIGEVTATVGGNAGVQKGQSVSATRHRHGMEQVIREIGNSTFVLFIDDFHYMPPDVQSSVAKQIKEAARRGVKICTASVPHRSDDVVRSNPELRGRIRAVDTKPWAEHELAQIGKIGFPILGYDVPEATIRRLASEAFTSPQLMQAICLQACFTTGISKSRDEMGIHDFSGPEIRSILQETATRTDFGSLIRLMHEGPKTRGTERKDYDLEDGSRGDVYRALLLAIRKDPAMMSLPWNALSKRIQAICKPDSPQASSLSTACSQIARIAREMYPGQRIVDWDGEPNNLLSIEDPYFLFYIRWSEKLDSLKKAL